MTFNFITGVITLGAILFWIEAFKTFKD